jgi:hypothetical protein
MTTLNAIGNVSNNVIDKWMIVSIVELLVIFILLFFLFRKKKNKPNDFYVVEGVESFKDANIDFSNMFNSMFNASKLHSTLKRKIHPDLFPNNPEKILIANDLTARLNESQNDIAKMKEIQDIAKEKLGIIF